MCGCPKIDVDKSRDRDVKQLLKGEVVLDVRGVIFVTKGKESVGCDLIVVYCTQGEWGWQGGG